MRQIIKSLADQIREQVDYNLVTLRDSDLLSTQCDFICKHSLNVEKKIVSTHSIAIQ